jgi:adenine-specific DNA methylase
MVAAADRRPPTTRYQGSKLSLLGWLREHLATLEFDSATDLMCGTGSVAYLLKSMGKSTLANDALRSNFHSAEALVENSDAQLTKGQVGSLLAPYATDEEQLSIVSKEYEGVFFLPEENRFLDKIVPRICRFSSSASRAIAFHALFQACLMKRPFNLFHRKNLHLRTAKVARSFGNKTTWDRPFEELFERAVGETNAAIFDNGRINRASCADAFAVHVATDLVYLDPPYLRAKGSSFRYADAYHFLEGLTDHAHWQAKIDRSKKHLPYVTARSVLEDRKHGADALCELIEAQRNVQEVVISYRSAGTPSIEVLERQLRGQRRAVRVVHKTNRYALAIQDSAEVLLLGSRPRRVHG